MRRQSLTKRSQTVTQSAQVRCTNPVIFDARCTNRNSSDMLKTILTGYLPATEVSFSLFVPLPGTSVYNDMKQDGYKLSQDWTDYDYYAKQPFEHELSRWELRMWQRLLGQAILCISQTPTKFDTNCAERQGQSLFKTKTQTNPSDILVEIKM